MNWCGMAPLSRIVRILKYSALQHSFFWTQTDLIEVDTNHISDALRRAEVYDDLYFGNGANIEIGLTGSKMHAVAFGAIAAAARVSAAWYVSPQTYDMQRFTTGAGETRCFTLQLR
jgi:hypothetical protein